VGKTTQAMVACRACAREYEAAANISERRYARGAAYRLACPHCGGSQLYQWAMRRRRMPDAVLIKGEEIRDN
jgi:hydrogenase maturation factor HypF (carbamoyltransferase family)